MRADKKEKSTRLTVKISGQIKDALEKAAACKHLSLVDYAKQVLERSCQEDRGSTRSMTPDELIEFLREGAKRRQRGRIFDVDSVDLINEAREERTRSL